MPAEKYLVEDLLSSLEASPRLTNFCTKIWIYNSKTVVIDFIVGKQKFALDLGFKKGTLIGSALGRDDSARRILRNALIGKCEMTKNNGERHMLGAIHDADEFPERAAAKCYEWFSYVNDLIKAHESSALLSRFDSISCVNTVWWDKKPNFGDAIGPWLVSKITGKSPINGLGLSLPSPPVMTVGSILNLVDQDHTVVWGTGLMGPLSNESATRLRGFANVTVRSVRGKLTRDEVVKQLGWRVPEVYGDPALLLPRFLPVPQIEGLGKSIVIVPHYMHLDYFNELESESVRVLDVRDGMEAVVRQIASAGVCVSTSLHGLIIAQAYGVPWVWVRVDDHKLGGDTFKFRDFFTTLDASAVSSVDVSMADISGLDMEAIAKTATIPELQISLDDLLQSFPSAEPEQIDAPNTASSRHADVERISDDFTMKIERLMRKTDKMTAELVVQRRLLEELAAAR